MAVNQTRNPEAYKLAKEQLEQLRSFCLANKDKNIIVINVLPRFCLVNLLDYGPIKNP